MLLLHFSQVYVYRAYRRPRELVWVAGCVLFFLMLGMAFTGYLLPWDRKAFTDPICHGVRGTRAGQSLSRYAMRSLTCVGVNVFANEGMPVWFTFRYSRRVSSLTAWPLSSLALE